MGRATCTRFLNNGTWTGEVHSIALQADGKILVGGLFSAVGGQTRNDIARLDATTGLADSFNPDPSVVQFGDGVSTFSSGATAALNINGGTLYVGAGGISPLL